MMGSSIFLSTPSARRATTAWMEQNDTEIFLSTPSARRATCSGICKSGSFFYFYPRPLRGGRPYTGIDLSGLEDVFLSTPSARRATRVVLIINQFVIISIHALCEEGDKAFSLMSEPVSYFYPRPLRGGRRVIDGNNAVSYEISIHALCEEGDPRQRTADGADGDFYPRPLRGGRQDTR